jgi:hypothetical protein
MNEELRVVRQRKENIEREREDLKALEAEQKGSG